MKRHRASMCKRGWAQLWGRVHRRPFLRPQALLMYDAGIQRPGDEPAEEIHRECGCHIAGKHIVDQESEQYPRHPKADAENRCAAQPEHAAMK